MGQVIAYISYTDQARGVAAVRANWSRIDEVCPSWWAPAADGSIVLQQPGVTVEDTTFVADAKAAGLRVKPALANYYGGGTWNWALLSTILNDPTLRATHVAAVVSLCQNKGYHGIDLDYEHGNGTDRAVFTTLVQELATALHQVGLLLSVVVHPKQSEPGPSAKTQTQDWAAIAAAADELRVMLYDYDPDAGPTSQSPISWWGNVTTWALTQVPASKLVLGAPTYGYDWVDGQPTNWVDGMWAELEVTRAARGATRNYSTTLEAPWFTYTTSNGVNRTVYYENTQSLTAKAVIVRDNDLHGMHFWRAGGEDPDLWLSISDTVSQGGSGPVQITLEPVGDAYIDEGDQDKHFGVGDLAVKPVFSRRSLLKFDMSTIPTGATINSATLRLYESSTAGTSPTGRTYRVNPVVGDWFETMNGNPATAGVTWTNRDQAGAAWTTAGGDYLASPSATATVPAVGQWMTWDVTALVAAGYGNYIIQDTVYSGNNQAFFAAREDSTADRHPQLVIDYTEVQTQVRTTTGALPAVTGLVAAAVAVKTATCALSINVGLLATASQVITATEVTPIDADVAVYDALATQANPVAPVPTAGGPLLEGDFLVFQLTLDDDVRVTGVPAGVTNLMPEQVANQTTNSTFFLVGAVYYKYVTAAEAASPPSGWTFTLNGLSSDMQVITARFRGVHPSDPIGTDAPGYYVQVDSAVDNRHIAPGLSIDVDNAFVITGVGHRSGSATITGPTNNTVMVNGGTLGGRSSALAHSGTLGAAGSSVNTATWAASNNAIGYAWRTALRPAGAASTPPAKATTGTLQAAAGLTAAAVPVKATTGTLPIGVGLAAASTPVKTTTGQLSISAGLAGSASAAKTTAGALPAGVALAGTVVPVRIATGSLPATAGLTATAVSAKTTTGALSADVGLQSAPPTSTRTITAALSVTVGLNGATLAANTTSGQLAVQVGLAGVPISVKASAGALPTNVGLAATATGAVRSTTGTLPVAVQLSGVPAGAVEVRTNTGTLPVTVGAASTAIPVGTTTGALPVHASPTGTAAAAKTASGSLPAQVALTGAAVPAKTSAGQLRVDAGLAATPTGATRTATGQLPAQVGLTGVPAGATEIKTTTGALPITVSPAATGAAVKTSTGQLPVTVRLFGSGIPGRTTSGVLSATIGLAAEAGATNRTTGTLPVTAVLQATVTGRLEIRTTAGTLPVTVTLAGTTTATRATAGSLPVTVALHGTPSAVLATSGTLPVDVRLAGILSASGPPTTTHIIDTAPDTWMIDTTADTWVIETPA